MTNKTLASRVKASRQKKRQVVDTASKRTKSAKGRTGLESDPVAWLKHYLHSAYPLPFGQVHRDIIDGALYSAETGGNFAVAAPRGTGKSSVLWGVALYLLMTGRIRFPAYLPWSAKDTRKALRFWKNALCYNERLRDGYPDICAPFHQCGGSAQKLLTLTINGKVSGAQLRISDGMIVMPANLGVIGSSTVNGNPRGLNHATESGEVLRPDLILIDDPQDKETSRSEGLVRNVIDVIDSDIGGMAGPDITLPMLMACTVMTAGDVADHYLGTNTPDWRSIRVPQIITWPDNLKAWDALNDIRISGEENKDGGKSGIDHYLANRADLIKGMEVSWEHRYDKKRGQPDAHYAAMIDYYRMGKQAFMAERQNQPERQGTQVYDLTTNNVTGKVSGLPLMELPDSARVLVAFTDINRSGLHWCAAAFGQDMTPHVAAYGRYPQSGQLWEENAPEQIRKQAIFRGLSELGKQLSGMPFTRRGQRVGISLFMIDRGYEPDVVHRFCQHAKLGFRLMPSRGYSAGKYQVRKATLVGSPFEHCHITETQFGQFVSHNADYWREISQRSWLGDLGEPGTATIFGDDPRGHTRFAEQCVCEQLVGKYQTDQGMRWEWKMRVGSHNDLGDAYAGCFVAAAVSGLNSSGVPKVQKRVMAERRKARVPIET